MSRPSRLDFSSFGPQVFPVEIFGYPEDSDDEIIYHVVVASLCDDTDLPPLPECRMRVKVVLATGEILIGTEI